MRLTAIQKQYHQNADDIIRNHSKERKLLDKSRLAELRSSMKKSILGEKLLKWADNNDIKIVIDRKTEAGGYYQNGLKLIGIGTMPSAETLAHEITHAIQDEYGLLSSIDGTSVDELKKHTVQNYMVQTHFTEAAAFAVGKFVDKEVQQNIRILKKDADKLTNELKKGNKGFLISAIKFYFKHTVLNSRKHISSKEIKEDLKDRFINHFRNSYITRFYEDRHLKIFAKNIGIKDIKIPCGTFEYDMEDLKLPYKRGVNLNNKKSVLQIGNILDEFNFLDDLPENFNKSAKFRKFKTNLSLLNSNEPWTTENEIKNKLLFRQIKHLQKR